MGGLPIVNTGVYRSVYAYGIPKRRLKQMSSKDYQAIATAINKIPEVGHVETYIAKNLLIKALIEVFIADNPNFNQDKFEEAVNS
jgi:hypothetical protein